MIGGSDHQTLSLGMFQQLGQTDEPQTNVMSPSTVTAEYSVDTVQVTLRRGTSACVCFGKQFSQGIHSPVQRSASGLQLWNRSWWQIIVYSSWPLVVTRRVEQRRVCSQPNCHFGLCNYCCRPTHLRAGKSLNYWSVAERRGKHCVNRQPRWLREVKSRCRGEASDCPSLIRYKNAFYSKDVSPCCSWGF